MTKRPVNIHKAYHAHVYFDQNSLALATQICLQAGEKFGLSIGRIHEKEVGPHPMWSCQISFLAKDFDQLIPWLEEQRQGLTVLVHGLTGNNLQDHTSYAYWLGESVPLKLAMFANEEAH
jgi:aromatic ring-cleaving dioxygenase